MNNNRIYIGQRIAEIRTSQGLTTYDLAEKSGITQSNICRIENGKYSAGIDVLGKIADALGVKIDLINNETGGNV